MIKIPFVNNGQPAINDTNLNAMQDNIETAVETPMTYSTTETEIGTWIDNKKIYRKVITGTVGTIENLINALNIDTMVDIKGWARSNYDNKWLFPSHSQANGGYNIDIYFDVASSQYRVVFGSYFDSARSVKVIVEYTKSTS